MERVNVEIPITKEDLDFLKISLFDKNTPNISWTLDSDMQGVEVTVKFIKKENKNELDKNKNKTN